VFPLQVQRAGIVGLELEAAALESLDLAGDAVAVTERGNVGLRLRECGRAGRDAKDRQDDRDRERANPTRTAAVSRY